MAKYIDAELLKKTVKLIREDRPILTIEGILYLIDSLQQEQPDNEDVNKVAQELYEHLYELKRRNNVPTNLYDKQEIIDLWKAGIVYGRSHPKHEQPEVECEDERHMTQTIGNILRWADEHPKEQKPNIELIQKSWYMEGYHDCEFGYEPKWIIKTGEGGPRYEENPKYGQHIEKQDYSDLTELEQAIHRGFLCAGVVNVPVNIIKETAQDCLAHLPAEWSDDFDKEVENVHKRYPEVSYAKLTRIAYHFSKWANRRKDMEWREQSEKRK